MGAEHGCDRISKLFEEMEVDKRMDIIKPGMVKHT